MEKVLFPPNAKLKNVYKSLRIMLTFNIKRHFLNVQINILKFSISYSKGLTHM